MTVRDAERGLANIGRLDGATVTVCLAARTNPHEPPSLHRLQLSDDLAETFLTSAADMLRMLGHEVANGDKVLVQYDAATPSDFHEVEVHDPPEESIQRAVIADLAELVNVPMFDGENRTIDKLVFHVIVIQRRRQPDIYIFRSYSRTKELTRSKKVVTIFANNVFDAMRDPIFIFDNKADAVWLNNTMLVLNQTNYHRIFQFFEEVLRHAERTLDDITQAIPIENADQFVADSRRHPIILAKLRSIAQGHYVGALTVAALERKIRNHELPIEVRGRGANKRLVYDRTLRWVFLKLIDDAYLNSDMTNARYEVTGKRVRA